MIYLETVSTSNVALLKSTRLRALQESPLAFGSTYEKESQLSDAEWLARARNWDGVRGIGFIALDQAALDPSIGCGIVGCFIHQDDAMRALLVSMWTAPAQRRHGLGRMLVQKIVEWLALHNVRTLTLMVTSVNQAGMRFYERLGFAPTGRTEPYPNHPDIVEYEMSRPIP